MRRVIIIAELLCLFLASSVHAQPLWIASTALAPCVTLGDSTESAYLSGSAVGSFMPINRVIISTAAPSHTIVQQQSVWTNTLLSTIKKSARFVVIRVGLNDLGPPESAATALGRYQTLVNTVAADAPQARIYTATMTPCKARLITLLGAIAGATAYQKWLDMNEAISGGGGIPITGMYGVITAHTDQLNDGAGNLVAAYDEGDGIHPKNAGRRIIALRYIDKLSIDGTLQGP